MRHISKKLTEKNLGEKREVSKFLFFPVKIGKEIRWFEKATILQVVGKEDIFHMGFKGGSYITTKIIWKNNKFL